MSDTIQDAPVETTEVVAEPTPVEPVVEEQVEQPSPLDDFTDEELQAAIEAAIAASEKPTEPVSFPKSQKEEGVKAELDSEIKALLQQKESELQEAKQTLQEKQLQSEQIESAWSMLNQALPDLPDIVTKLIAGDEQALPTFFKKDFQERLQADTILWPLIDAHIRGEKPDYPGFVRSLAASKMKAMPKTSDAPQEPTIPEDHKPVTGRDILSNNKKTISLT